MNAETATEVGADTESRAQRLLFTEARLLDAHAYEQWLALWADGEVVYWVLGAGAPDPDRTPSIIYDERPDLEARVERLASGWAMGHDAEVRLCRSVSNIEVGTTVEGIHVESVVNVVELRRERRFSWVGRVAHDLVETPGGLRIARKHVDLVDRHLPTPVLAIVL